MPTCENEQSEGMTDIMDVTANAIRARKLKNILSFSHSNISNLLHQQFKEYDVYICHYYLQTHININNHSVSCI